MKRARTEISGTQDEGLGHTRHNFACNIAGDIDNADYDCMHA